MEREVIRVEQEGEKPVEFTEWFDTELGVWKEAHTTPHDYAAVFYFEDLDLFLAKDLKARDVLFKGHLNSGKY